MGRVLRPLGCFGSTLLAILVVLGVTETLKHVGSLERVLALSAAVLASAALAFLREKWIARPPTVDRPVATERSERLGAVAQLAERQSPRADHPARNVALPAPPRPEPPASFDDPILGSRQQAILFRQIVPPSHDLRHLSFFGGAPIAPLGFQWPEVPDPKGRPKPISFLMQIDCSAIPAAGRLGLMPDRGVLYVFLDGEANAFRMLYEQGPPDGWNEISPPETLGTIYASRGAWKWPQSDADWPRLWPKWPFDPMLVQGGPLPDDKERLEETYAWPGTIESLSDVIRTIPGAVVPLKTFRPNASGDGGEGRRPFETFPQDWGAVRITTGLLANLSKLHVDGPPRRMFKDLSDEQFAGLLDAVASERRQWEARAATAAASDALPQDERDRFWAWMMERDWLTRLVMPEAATLSVEASLASSADAGTRIPADATDRIHHRHALAVETERGLHINVPDRMLAAPVDVQGTIDERVREFLLLLELSSNDGLAHYFGEGVFQFWIRPADLAARRFDRVEFSATAY